jgi:hypothetical protein
MIFSWRSGMRIALPLFIVSHSIISVAANSKPHAISFGKWISVQWERENAGNDKNLKLKVRPLLVDAHVKEFSFGPIHEVTDRLFVVRRAFRINESLPQESDPPRWQWQPGGWIIVDRATGHVSPISLPEFDAFSSAASWYRDYIAYCGVSDDGKTVYAEVAQMSRRKPILKKPLPSAPTLAAESKESSPEYACPAPVWQRDPPRVTFEPVGEPKQTFAIRGRAVDLMPEEEDEEASK